MSKVTLDIGGVPVFVGQYVAGAYYLELHRVTHLGSEFQAKREGYLPEPVVLINDGNDYRVSEDWQIVSNGTDALIIANTVNRVYTTTETAWAALQADAERFATFCQQHKGWAVDVVEDGYVPPEPEPTHDKSSFTEGTLTVHGTFAEGTLKVKGKFAEGVLTI